MIYALAALTLPHAAAVLAAAWGLSILTGSPYVVPPVCVP